MAAIAATVVGAALIGTAVVLASGDDPPATTTLKIKVSEDTYVVREQPDSAFGAEDKLVAVSKPDYYAVTYLKFDVPIPTGYRIAAMSLLVQAQDKPPSHVKARSVLSSDWTQKDLAYAHRPGLGDVLNEAPAVSDSNLITFNVDNAIQPLTQPMPTASQYSFAVTNASDSKPLTLYAGEHGEGRAVLEVTYIEATATDSEMREAIQGRESPDPSRKPSGTPSPGASASGTPDPGASPSTGASTGPPPNLPTGSTLCGASFYQENGESYTQALAREDGYFGGMEAARVFYPGAPANWPGSAGNAKRTVIVSFKYNPKEILNGSRDSYLRGWFAGAPRDRDVYWVYYHEPEDNIESGVFTAADYRAAWRRLAGLADQAGNPKLHATLVLMDWTLMSQSGRKWRDYYPGADVIDVLGWDVYNWDKNKYTSADDLVGRVQAISNGENKPWGIAEMGSAKISTDSSGSGRAGWLTSMANKAITGKALWITYFDINWSTADFRLRDSVSQRAWRDFCDR
ncbi:CBM96 family carbohydrate-binding protein [Catellatospora tritici]|uniref:CBM96 family carbohydrate-binding protein n=1 Tax=Catellatospora tritici TaxID=2851566 RepID=UPI001C2D1695|nr:DNRLRE domain-containing protein [Catellatospora tritici]MBV1853478.1 DNRLRE domain-containing protein [Catellatospora tritici]